MLARFPFCFFFVVSSKCAPSSVQSAVTRRGSEVGVNVKVKVNSVPAPTLSKIGDVGRRERVQTMKAASVTAAAAAAANQPTPNPSPT